MISARAGCTRWQRLAGLHLVLQPSLDWRPLPQQEKLTSTSTTRDADKPHKKRGAELLGIDGRATQHPAGIATVAAFRPWRSSQTRSH